MKTSARNSSSQNERMIDGPLQVLMVCEPLSSGVPSYLASLVRRMEGKEFHFTIACPEKSILRKTLQDIPTDVRVVRMQRGLGFPDFRALYDLVRLLRTTRFDIVHLHSSKAGLIARLPAKVLQHTVIFTPHSFSFESVRNNHFVYRLFVAVEKFLGRFTDKLVCVSEAEADLARSLELVSHDKVSVIRNFYDPAIWFPRNDQNEYKVKLGFREGQPIVGTISRFFPQKAPLDFIEMAEMIHRSIKNAAFVVVGEGGPLKAEVQKRITSYGLEKVVRLIPWTSNLPDIVAAFDVVVSTSIWEGMPLSLIEAMAMAKAIVATDIPPHRELFRLSCGVLCPLHNPPAFSEAVKSLLNDREARAALGFRAHEIAKRHFTLNRAVEELRCVYHERKSLGLSSRSNNRSIPGKFRSVSTGQ